MKFPSSPLWLTAITGMCLRKCSTCWKLHGSCFFFRLPKMNDRWWSHCTTDIAWSSRSSPEPTPSLSLWVEHSFGGYFFGFEPKKQGIAILLRTTQSLKDSLVTQRPSKWMNDMSYTEVGQSWSKASSAHRWAAGHISPCVSPLSIGLLQLFHNLAFGYSLTSLSLAIHSKL